MKYFLLLSLLLLPTPSLAMSCDSVKEVFVVVKEDPNLSSKEKTLITMGLIAKYGTSCILGDAND
jgi:hypothetical protein